MIVTDDRVDFLLDRPRSTGTSEDDSNATHVARWPHTAVHGGHPPLRLCKIIIGKKLADGDLAASFQPTCSPQSAQPNQGMRIDG